ncbi:MAG: hypothetical protein U1B78_02755 [Dehalococcoidia bacterium]|nr:hypothetical protein [Dehalococcoidia bacterium]
MADVVCLQAIELLNGIFGTPFILNDGHEILQRLEAGDDVSDIAEDIGAKFGKPAHAAKVRNLVDAWPSLHMEAVTGVVQWALGKLDTDDRVTIKWKGDAENPETVTRFELRDNTLLIEFAHPPASLTQATPA